MTQKRVAIVTGGGRGIGRGISLGLGAAGYAVAVVYFQQREDAETVITELKAAGTEAKIYQTDVAKKTQVKDLMAQVVTDFERVDVLVNNAGTATKSGTVDLAEEVWERVIDVNIKGTFLCSQAVIPIMQRQHYGRIINLSSIAGQSGGGIGPHYAASKAGIIGLTRFMARELGPDGITVNAIAPSGVPTAMLEDMGFKADPNRPVGRVGTLEDIAAATCYLASEAAGYVTGQLLAVNGGRFIG